MVTPEAARSTDAELRRIQDALRHREPDGPAPLGASAVLAPLVPLDAGLCFLFERRPAGRSFFAGQLSFPGGRIEASDASPLDAALRETEEEVGIRPQDVRILGHLHDTRDPMGRRVSCFVGEVNAGKVPSKAASPQEVEEILLVPLSDLRAPLEPPTVAGAAPSNLYRVTGYEARMVPSEERVLQYWPLRGERRGATLWGFTAGVVATLLHRVYAWSPPVAPRVVDRWEDLQP